MRYKRIIIDNWTAPGIYEALLKHDKFSMYISFNKTNILDHLISRTIYTSNLSLENNIVKAKPEDLDGKPNVIDVRYHLTPNSIKEAILLYEV